MKQNNRAGSRLFFIEFLIVIFFFLMISTVCLKLFARAHMITQEANALSMAQSVAASIAAAAEGSDGTADAVLAFFPEAEIVSPDAKPQQSAKSERTEPSLRSDSSLRTGSEAESAVSDSVLRMFFDRDFHTCSDSEAFYTLTALLSVDNSEKTALISIHDPDGGLLYELPVSFHKPQTKKEVLS